MLLIVMFGLLTLHQTSLTQSEKVVQKAARSLPGWHRRYHNLNEINEKLNEINSTFDNAFLFSLGKTYQKRDMMAIKITGKKKENKPVFFTQCLIHAREWVSGSVCMYFADQMAQMYGKDYKITALLDKMDFVILPVANPDGYSYSWISDVTRLWQRNRKYQGNSCGNKYGVDLNRNFGYHWGEIRARPIDQSGYPCHETYHGLHAFSEKETRNIRDYLTSLGGNLKGFIDFHSYGQKWYYPWHYTYKVDPPHKKEQVRVSIEAVRTIWRRGYGTSYYIQSAGLPLTEAGGSMDWVYGQLGVKYSFMVKLKDAGGRNKYKLPPQHIESVARETLEGLKALVKAMNV